MMIKRFVTFFVVASLFLWMPTVTVKKDLRGMANTIVELVELVEEYQGSNNLDEKIISASNLENNLHNSYRYSNEQKLLTWLLAYEVLTPPPDLC